MTETVEQPRRLGVIGSLVGLLALVVSALTRLLPETFLSKPVYQTTLMTEVLGTGAAALAVIAIAFAVVAIICKEEKFLAGVAVALGAAAIAVQIWWIFVLIVIAIIIANSVLS